MIGGQLTGDLFEFGGSQLTAGCKSRNLDASSPNWIAKSPTSRNNFLVLDISLVMQLEPDKVIHKKQVDEKHSN